MEPDGDTRSTMVAEAATRSRTRFGPLKCDPPQPPRSRGPFQQIAVRIREQGLPEHCSSPRSTRSSGSQVWVHSKQADAAHPHSTRAEWRHCLPGLVPATTAFACSRSQAIGRAHSGSMARLRSHEEKSVEESVLWMSNSGAHRAYPLQTR